jgi:hypothetical protein
MALTGPSPCVTHERSSGPSLAPGSVVPLAQAVIRPPPTPTRHPSTSRRKPVIGRDSPVDFRSHRAGEGLPSSRRHLLDVPRPIRREVHRGCASRLFTPSVAFAVNAAARLLLLPPEGGPLTTRQASLDAADRRVAPPTGLSTLGFDPTRFQAEPPACYRAILAATRAGLSPAGDDELMLEWLTSDHLQLWARARSGLAHALHVQQGQRSRVRWSLRVGPGRLGRSSRVAPAPPSDRS